MDIPSVKVLCIGHAGLCLTRANTLVKRPRKRRLKEMCDPIEARDKGRYSVVMSETLWARFLDWLDFESMVEAYKKLQRARWVSLPLSPFPVSPSLVNLAATSACAVSLWLFMHRTT
jgi:hypothetical protein